MSDFENIGVDSPTGADGTADKAFEMFKNGASIEEVNNVLLGKETEPQTSAPFDNSEQNADGVTYENDNNPSDLAQPSQLPLHKGASDAGTDGIDDGHSQNGADSVINRIADNDDDKTGAAASDEKLISQDELDLLVGRRLAKERRAHDRVKADFDLALDGISKLLGVSREEALTSLKKAIYRREAEEKNISDVDMYERLKIAEEKNAEYENAQKERDTAQDIEDFKNTITMQIGNLNIPDAELSMASADNDFNKLVRYFYDNPLTRDDCVSMAYNAFAKKNNISTPHPSIAPQMPPSSQGEVNGNSAISSQNITASGNGDVPSQAPSIPKPKRARENASSTGTAAPDSKMDIENMKLNDFNKILERLQRGETVMP